MFGLETVERTEIGKIRNFLLLGAFGPGSDVDSPLRLRTVFDIAYNFLFSQQMI